MYNRLAFLPKKFFVKSAFFNSPLNSFSKLNYSLSSTMTHLAPEHVPVSNLEVASSFHGLTHNEAMYSHFLSKTSWLGQKIVFEQVSEESPVLFNLFQKLFSANPIGDWAEKVEKNNLKEEFQHFLVYASMFYGNGGNYNSFGDTKFVPRINQETFVNILKLGENDQESIMGEYKKCEDKIWSLEPKEQALGFHPVGTSTYYSLDLTKPEIEKVQKYMDKENINPYNTRIFKIKENHYEIKIASADQKKHDTVKFEDIDVDVTFGDYSEVMKSMVLNLQEALKYAANENQKKMIESYISHFQTGSIEDHKESQRHWIKDIGPSVETNIGFIESYRDPLEIRGEFESFVAVVNKEMSKKFANLVTGAEKLISLLPWPKEFEKDEFLRPDFTSLEVLTFATSGIPAGINIPNYDDIRQTEGFKNVSLGNVVRSAVPNEKITFLQDSDQDLFRNLKSESFEVQVGLHELLGHGSGKLLAESKDGKLNFDKNLINPITNEAVQTWYKPGETWNGKFPGISSSYEECRAESVGLYLCVNEEILKIFGHEQKEGTICDVVYINWLSMVRAGLLGLEFFTPETKSWGQAHMRARFAILNVLLEAGADLVTLDLVGDDDILIKIDREKIISVGVPAISAFLHKLNIYKATADNVGATKMYDEYTISSIDDKFLKLREIVIAKKQPRKVFVQAHTEITDGKVQLQEFDATYQGMIESFIKRYA